MKKNKLVLLVVLCVFILVVFYFFTSHQHLEEREVSNTELKTIPVIGHPTPEFIEAVQKAVKESKKIKSRKNSHTTTKTLR